MGLSARTDDFTGLPLGDSFLTFATSAGNALLFASPASKTAYYAANNGSTNGLAQEVNAANNNNGGFNTQQQGSTAALGQS